jgi:hypothetical protein
MIFLIRRTTLRLLLLLGTSIVLGLCLVLSPFNANASNSIDKKTEERIEISEPDIPPFHIRYPTYGWHSDHTDMDLQCWGGKKEPDPDPQPPKDPRENL